MSIRRTVGEKLTSVGEGWCETSTNLLAEGNFYPAMTATYHLLAKAALFGGNLLTPREEPKPLRPLEDVVRELTADLRPDLDADAQEELTQHTYALLLATADEMDRRREV